MYYKFSQYTSASTSASTGVEPSPEGTPSTQSFFSFYVIAAILGKFIIFVARCWVKC